MKTSPGIMICMSVLISPISWLIQIHEDRVEVNTYFLEFVKVGGALEGP